MTRLLRCLAAMLLACPGVCGAAWTLPVAELPEAPALRPAMAALLADYQQRLPTLYSLDPRTDKDNKYHSWSPARDRFAGACSAEKAQCERLLAKQIDLLMAAVQGRTNGAPASLQDAVTLSAMVDLCGFSWGRDLGWRCLPDRLQAMAGGAASVWHILGYQHLFIAFATVEEQSTAQLASWVREDDTLNRTQKADKLGKLGAGAGQTTRRAFNAELSGMLADAASLWGMNYARLAVANTDPSGQLTALANMARLAARQGRFERAVQWQAAARSLAGAHAELAKEAPCVLLQQQFDLDLEQTGRAGRQFPAVGRIRQLIEQDCAFSSRALQTALAMLAQARPEEAAQVLAAAQDACARPPGCGHTRSVQIGQLLAVARPDATGWRKAAAAWQERLAMPEQLLATEIDLVWALAERLRASDAAAEALPLFQQLDRHVGQLRKARNSPPDMARYDDLTRMRARLELASGLYANLDDTESLRGQTLLRQLTLARWGRELAGVQDAEALADLNEQLGYAVAMRALLSQLAPDQLPSVQASFETMLDDIKEREPGFREAYLARLAQKKSGIERLKYSTALPLSAYERWDAFKGADGRALDADDAYLSWLRVPGGYIGTLLARPSGRQGKVDANNPHVRTQRFIAFSETDEAVLELYRQMLQNGSSMVRGARVSAPLGTDAGGLMLGQLPLWQLSDGSLQGAAVAPAGARRVTQFSTLSDALYARLLAPFAPHYQEAQRLIVSPDGALVYLPFETLSRQGVSVLESVDIGYVQSLAVYGELKRRVAGRRHDGGAALLSVADPVYAAGPAPAPAPGAASPLAALSWPPLPGTRVESRALAKLFEQPRQLLGAAASRTVLDGMAAQKELKRFRVLHFATHGYVDDARSALVLTPGSAPLSAYLSDQDIVQWELESDLVLLSACNTGIGRRQQGEGVVGLPYAFFMAGNLNTLMSLWPVDDQGTAALIPAFMGRVHAGEDHVTALNNTKRAFARGDYGQALRNPRIWSAFVLYGVPLTATPSTQATRPETGS